MSELINIITAKYNSDGYYFFIECVDKAGNVNEDEFFIEIDKQFILS